MTWDIREGKDAEYNDFVVNEFIPRGKRLGLHDIQFWYTTYGDCEQIQASATTPNQEQMDNILASDGWDELCVGLSDYVEKITQKVVKASRSDFQL